MRHTQTQPLSAIIFLLPQQSLSGSLFSHVGSGSASLCGSSSPWTNISGFTYHCSSPSFCLYRDFTLEFAVHSDCDSTSRGAVAHKAQDHNRMTAIQNGHLLSCLLSAGHEHLPSITTFSFLFFFARVVWCNSHIDFSAKIFPFYSQKFKQSKKTISFYLHSNHYWSFALYGKIKEATRGFCRAYSYGT